MKSIVIAIVTASLLTPIVYSAGVYAAGNEFNPQMSLILDGRYTDYSQDPDAYTLPGFQLGEEAELNPAGFAISESEITMSANIDQYFSGRATLAFSDEGAEVEEAYIQTLAVGHGVNVKFGRLLSSFGYLNAFHAHSWDFADVPLMYRSLFANSLKDDGIQVNYLFPSDIFIQLSAEAFSGNAFPAAGNVDGGIGASTLSLTFGGDIGSSHAWQSGISHWQANHILERSDAKENTFSGSSKIDALHAVYKWSPDRNARERHLKIQMEYFQRSEDGAITEFVSSNSSTYSGDQRGGYAQLVYQFIPRWRAGIRFDQLSANNTGNNLTVLNNTGLLTAGYNPQRHSAMIEWLPSEFSRLRLQFNNDQSADNISDKQVFMQYTFSLGAHGAHAF